MIPDFAGAIAMYKKILVPIDLADTELVKPAIETAVSMARMSHGTMRLINVLPMTPVMLAEYVPPDFDVQQRKSSEEALAIIAGESPGSMRRTCHTPYARAASITRYWKRRRRSRPTSS